MHLHIRAFSMKKKIIMKVCSGNEYFETLKPSLYVLKIFGILPFILNNKETPCRKIITLMINLFSIIVYFIASGSSMIFIGNNVVNLMKHFSFVHFVRISTEITLRVYVLIIPFTMWNKSNFFTEYYDDWKSLQNDLELIRGTSYKCSVKRRIRWIAYLPLILLVIFSILHVSVRLKTSTSHSLSTVLIASISNATLGYWYSNCIFTRQVIQIIHTHVEKTMNEEVNNEKLQKLANLWLNICDLIDRFNSIHSIIFLAQTILGVTNGISNFYSAILWFNLRGNESQSANLAEGLLSYLIGVSITYTYCESANTVYNQLVHRTLTLLLAKNTSKMSTNCLTTVCLFLNTIEAKDPKIVLNGVLKIDRSTFIIIMGVGINYLIVLMQFGTLYVQQFH